MSGGALNSTLFYSNVQLGKI